MTTSRELLLAILSMDAYNRGYSAGLITGTDQIGSAKFKIESDTLTNTPGVNAGFYASSYTLTSAVGDLSAGTTIIS